MRRTIKILLRIKSKRLAKTLFGGRILLRIPLNGRVRRHSLTQSNWVKNPKRSPRTLSGKLSPTNFPQAHAIFTREHSYKRKEHTNITHTCDTHSTCQRDYPIGKIVLIQTINFPHARASFVRERGYKYNKQAEYNMMG